MNPLRSKLHLLIDEIVDAIEATATTSEWVDQTNSPLGRRRHLLLARTGILKHSREKGHVWIRLKDIETYLVKNTVIKVDEKADEAREVARILATMGRKNSAA